MAAYSNFQEREFERAHDGYSAITHQSFVGTGYFDEIAQIIAGGRSSTLALKGSTEEAQFSLGSLHFCPPN
jgi:isocitrate lyase